MKKSILLLSVMTFALAGCAMFQPKNFSKYSEGEWQGKVLVKDKVENRSGIVNVKIKAIDGQKLRMDVTSAVGTHLASVLVNGNDVEYMNVAEKTVVITKASRDSLRTLLKIPIEPHILYNVFFDRPIENKTWSCSSEKGLLHSCKDRQTGVDIEWLSREGAKRTIALRHKVASVQINLYDFVSPVTNPEKAFILNTPKSFKVKKL